MRTATVGLLSLLCVLPSLHAQEAPDKHSLFGCSAGAVHLDWDKKPPLRITPLSNRPHDVGEDHEFLLQGTGPFNYINIHLSATLPESRVGHASTAKLHIYAETAVSAFDHGGGHGQWWKVEPPEAVFFQYPYDKSSTSFSFDAARVGGCFGQDDGCSFADVALATADPNLPLLAIKFGENLGGANASNWTEASVLLDFRSSPPRVLATADCGYNEGGGACTAQDSAEMPRSGLQCDWASESEDFLCSDISSEGGGYLDFFLLGDKPAPLRADEVATLEDAIHEFRAKGTTAPVKVRGIGPVSWIDEVKLNSRNKVIVLGSTGLFHFVPESASGLGSPKQVKPHPLIEDPDAVPNPSVKVNATGWTLESAASFHSRPIYKGKDLTVLQVVESQLPDSQELHWLGIHDDGTAGKFDAVQLVGGGHYASCGDSIAPEEVVSIGRIAKPFLAQVRIQPATLISGSDDPQYRWATADQNVDQGKEVPDCIHTGQIAWKNGKFTGSMDKGECGSPEKPKYIHVDTGGKITVTEKPTKYY